MNSFLIFLITLACATTVEAVCYAPAQADASCMQKHGDSSGYYCAQDKNCYWTGASLYSNYDGASCRAVQTCTAATVVQCQASAQADASCMQKHGDSSGYYCAQDKNCYWTGPNLYSNYGDGTCRAKETCVDNAVSTLSKGEKVQVGLLVGLVIPLLALIAVYMVLLAKSIIPTKKDAAADADGEEAAADTDEQEDQLTEKRGWFGCCKKKAEVIPEEAEEGVLVENENTVDAKEDEEKAPGDNQDEQV